MRVIDHLVEWDSFDLRVSGRKVQELISFHLRKRRSPVSGLSLEFLEGKLMVSARIRKGLPIPVACTVSRIEVVGKTLAVVVENVSTFGVVPIPRLLLSIPWLKELPRGIAFDPETLTVSVSLEQFLPSFIDVTIESIRMVPGGVAVHFGTGSADFQAE